MTRPPSLAALENAVEHMLEGVQVLDRDLRYAYINAAACRQGRKAREELLDRTMPEVYPGIEDTDLYSELQRCLRDRTPARMLNEFQYESGESGWFELAIEPVPEGLCVLSIDVTDRVRAVARSEQLQQHIADNEKHEAIGRLAGGIAHDFNNSLQAIAGYARMIVQEASAPAHVRDWGRQIEQAAKAATDITRQLLAVGRRQTMQPRPIDFAAEVRATEGLVRRLMDAEVEVHYRTTGDESVVVLDPAQLQHIVLNLAANARDAMPEGGQLTVETSVVELDDAYRRLRPEVRPGRYAVLTVSDNGVGIDESTQQHIFEPFFTTKGDGKGTGLGLASVYGVVKQCGGHIWLYSEPGQGTTIKLHFTLAESGRRPTTVTVPADARAVAHGGHEAILMVEDNDGVRSLFARVLVRAGYRVLAAGDGDDALRQLRESGVVPQLLLTDVILPGRSGPELFRELAAEWPNLKLVLTSGYSATVIEQRGLSVPAATFLEKPVSPDALLSAVRRLLDGASPGAN